MSETNTAMALCPTSLAEARQLATTLAEAKSISKELQRSPADIMLTICAGMELGVPPMTALRCIHIVEGKPTLSAELMVGLVLGSGQCEYFRLVQSTDEIATFATKRVGGEHCEMSFTLDQAKQANKYPGHPKGPWACYTADMLRARAKARLCREVYPDRLAGVYTTDELNVDVVMPTKAPPKLVDVKPVIDVPANDAKAEAKAIDKPNKTESKAEANPEPKAEAAAESEGPPEPDLRDAGTRRREADEILDAVGQAENAQQLNNIAAKRCAAFREFKNEFEELGLAVTKRRSEIKDEAPA